MRNRWRVALVIAAALASTSAAAQDARGDVPAGAQQGKDNGGLDLIWNLIGLSGLIGLTGLWRSSDNDGYTDDPIEP